MRSAIRSAMRSSSRDSTPDGNRCRWNATGPMQEPCHGNSHRRGSLPAPPRCVRHQYAERAESTWKLRLSGERPRASARQMLLAPLDSPHAQRSAISPPYSTCNALGRARWGGPRLRVRARSPRAAMSSVHFASDVDAHRARRDRRGDPHSRAVRQEEVTGNDDRHVCVRQVHFPDDFDSHGGLRVLRA